MHTTGSGPTEEHIKDVCQLSYTFNEVKKKTNKFQLRYYDTSPSNKHGGRRHRTFLKHTWIPFYVVRGQFQNQRPIGWLKKYKIQN